MNKGLNTSLIDTMFLVWSINLMTNLSWEEIVAFMAEAKGLLPTTTRALYDEAMRKVEDYDYSPAPRV